MNKIITFDNLSRYHDNVQSVIDSKVQKLMTDTELKFFCIEPVTVVIRGESTTYEANTLVDIFLKSEDEFEFYIKVCARGRFGLKYNEFIFEEVKRLFREESLSNN